MLKLSEDADAQLRNSYGDPLLFSEKGNIKGINEQYFAAYLAKATSMLYEPLDKSLYTYILLPVKKCAKLWNLKNREFYIWQREKLVRRINYVLSWKA